MAIDYKNFQNAVYAWVVSQVSQPCIWDKPNQPRPKPPYVTLSFITTGVRRGGRGELRDEGSGFSVNDMISITVSVKSYSQDTNEFQTALSTISTLQISLAKEDVGEALRKKGVAIWDEGSILDISELLESGFEQRASMDVIFGFVNTDPNAGAGQITSVDLEGIVDTDLGNSHGQGPDKINP